ncbi:putative reverse transcriptase domain-containing protein [Tanacetum coccineum]
MPPRRIKKKSVRKIVEKGVARAIEKYEKTRADSNNAVDPVQQILKECSTEVHGYDIEESTHRFHELAFDCLSWCQLKRKRLKSTFEDFPREMERKCYFFKAATLHDAINMARELIKQRGQAEALRIGDSNKRNAKAHHQPGRVTPRCVNVHSLVTREGECRTGFCSGMQFAIECACFGCGIKGTPRSDSPKLRRNKAKTSWRLELPQELSRVHHTFHVSNLKKCHVDEPLVVPLDGLHINDKLYFIEENIEIRSQKVVKNHAIPKNCKVAFDLAPIVTIPLLPDFGGVTDWYQEPRIMPPRRFKKKSVRKIVEKRVARAIEKYEKTRTDSNNAGGSGSANTEGTVAPEVQGCSYKTFMNGKPHSFSGTEGVVGRETLAEALRIGIAIKGMKEPAKGTTSLEANRRQELQRVMLQPQLREGECRTRIPVAGGNSLQNVTCFGCGNQGHYMSDCPKVKEPKLRKTKVEVGTIAYRLELPQELSRVHHTFHVSNLKKCHVDEPLVVPLDGLHIDDKLYFIEENIEIRSQKVEAKLYPKLSRFVGTLGKELSIPGNMKANSEELSHLFI